MYSDPLENEFETLLSPALAEHEGAAASQTCGTLLTNM
jgi:hypothetical protein